MSENKLCLFEGYGIELEYMIVSNETLAVLPVTDQLIKAEVGEYKDVERGPVAWSNELVLHVLELKTNGPAPDLSKVYGDVQRDVNHINRLLGKFKGRLMPTGMHPFMDPRHETRLWPHEHNEVYEMFNRIFDCRGHGWANVQSTHLNLPFGNDEEFGRLHAAIRLLLPLMPALAASSPLMDGKASGVVDTRMYLYKNNAMRVPSVTGQIIPETGSYTRKDYEMNILARVYQDLSPHDPDGILQHEWANARGAIARFERSAIEIRVLDTQECPQADIAICAVIVDILKALTKETWAPLADQKTFPTAPLAAIMKNVINTGQAAVIEDEKYLRQFNFKGNKATAGELLQHLVESVWPASAKHADDFRAAITLILQRGNLSQRIMNAVGKDLSRDNVKAVYGDLCECLTKGKMYGA